MARKVIINQEVNGIDIFVVDCPEEEEEAV
jgi:hypothetical protein